MKMNTLLLLTGIALVAIATYNFTALPKSPDAVKAPQPKEGDVEIRQQGDSFWIYRYTEHPGWKIQSLETTLEKARQAKSKLDETRKPEVLVR